MSNRPVLMRVLAGLSGLDSILGVVRARGVQRPVVDGIDTFLIGEGGIVGGEIPAEEPGWLAQGALGSPSRPGAGP